MQGKNPLRGVTQEIDYEMKFDAFMTLMEVKKSARNCMGKNGCTFGFDFCTTAKCGPCEVTAGNRYKGGACTPKSQDVDKETEIVNSITKEELLDVAAEMMMDEYMYDKDE